MSFEHEGVLSMPPIADGPVTAGQAADPATIPSVGVDPVRVVVHGMLAIYLLPVILIVCLIGVTSILASKVARMAVKVGDRLTRRNRSRTARPDEDKNGPRLIYQHQRSRSAR
jgi:hypothetical protein